MSELIAPSLQAIGLLIFWPLLVAFTAVTSYYILRKANACDTHAHVKEAMLQVIPCMALLLDSQMRSCSINAALGSNFANTVLLTTVTIVSTQLARQVVAFERWHPRHVTNVRC